MNIHIKGCSCNEQEYPSVIHKDVVMDGGHVSEYSAVCSECRYERFYFAYGQFSYTDDFLEANPELEKPLW